MESRTMKKMLMSLLAAPLIAVFSQAATASEAGYRLDRAPIDPTDIVSLQAGARTFANYCQNCHGAQFLRYNRLTDIGLTEAQIKDNLLFAGDKVGDTMKTALSAKDGKAWFGVAPPDLSVISRSRGSDWLYTYLRTFYRDPSTPTGWNNAVFPNVGMPHALWTLQGERGLEIAHVKGPGHDTTEYKWTQISEGRQNATQYDTTVRDLVNYLAWMGEPSANSRKKLGVVVLFFLGVLFVLAYAMKREFWKDVH
jgi:ubiquinol-cytochrome c reductase cytochrome c1 subunit